MYLIWSSGHILCGAKLKLAEYKMFDRLFLISLYRCVMKLFTSNNVNSEIKKRIIYIIFIWPRPVCFLSCHSCSLLYWSSVPGVGGCEGRRVSSPEPGAPLLSLLSSGQSRPDHHLTTSQHSYSSWTPARQWVGSRSGGELEKFIPSICWIIIWEKHLVLVRKQIKLWKFGFLYQEDHSSAYLLLG